MKTKLFRKISLILSVIMILSVFAGCGTPPSPDETVSTPETYDDPTEQTTQKITEAATTEEVTTEEITTEEITTEEVTTEEITTEEITTEEITTEEVTTEEVTTEEITTEEITTEEETLLSYEIHKSDLDDLMQDMLDGNTMLNETVMFIDYGDVKSLMYYADEIISVTSYDGIITYVEGVDYELRDGKIVLLENSNIPCITSEVYYNNTSSDTLTMEHDGKICNVYWGEGRTMTQWQVNVTYTHSDTWEGYRQDNYIEIYEEFLGKLCRGEDVTVFFYGDSITRGANASSYVDHAPYQPDYTKLFVYALADLFDYKVTHIRTGLYRTFEEDFPIYNMGDRRGTITYINSAVGGKDCSWALDNVQEYVINVIEGYGCDLFVTNFGMNNGYTSAKTFQSYTKQMLNVVLEAVPDTSVMIVSSMLSNPDDTESGKNQILFEEPLLATAEGYMRAGTPCALVCMGSMSKSILEHKDFNDYSANNVNHPNDFFMRVYAQTLLQALIGYENMK